MPIYEFKCSFCERTHDYLQKFDDPAPVCPECASEEPMTRLISESSFRLKGDGWYETDYKNK